MNFKAKQFCIDYNIPYWESGNNVSPGWINITCPMCGDKSSHGGINPNGGYYHCWRCGGHALKQIIKTLLNISYFEVEKIIQEYSGISSNQIIKQKLNTNTELNLPPEAMKLNYTQKEYLKSRGFNPFHLQSEYKLKATSYFGEYAYRIIIPIYLDGKLVSYQGRDYTGKHDLKYKACKKENEIIHHKHIVYNADNCNQDFVILVEGVTDVWRLGDNTAALFGISYTIQQIEFIKNRWKRVCIFFDSEIQAQEKANKLGASLSGMGIDVQIAHFPNIDDPGNLNDKEAMNIKNQIMKELI